MRIFVAHRKDETDDAVGACIARFCERFPAQSESSFTRGKTDYEANFKRLGGWDAWCTWIVGGTVYGSSKRNYDLILVTLETVGAATAKIVQGALAANLPVIGEVNNQFQRIKRVEKTDGNFKSGWRCAP